MSIEIRSVTKRFGQFTALDDISLEVRPGELLALLGPSGSGKTTLLRIVAGLEYADPGSGPVLFDGEDVTRRTAAARHVGFAFQHYALFRHMTVFENIAFGLRVRPRRDRPNAEEISRRVGELLQLVQLEQYEQRFPSQLSGGQRQRVALARALAVEPKVLLLDEPFGALDAKVRKGLRRWLRQLHEAIPITSIFVTHDQDEALEVADRVVVMNDGRIEQIGTPNEVYDHPANAFVCEFLGNVNLFQGRIRNGRVMLGEKVFVLPRPLDVTDVRATAYVRPHEMRIVDKGEVDDALPALVRLVNSAGSTVRLELERVDDGSRFAVELSRDQGRELGLRVGDQVFVQFKTMRVFADDYSI